MGILFESQALSFAYPNSTGTLHDLNISIKAGENFGIVGESGSGKSTLLKIALGILTPTTGEIRLHGKKLNSGDKDEMVGYRKSVQVVFQDPYSSLDPRQRVDRIIAEPLRSLGLAKGGSRNERNNWITNEVIETLRAVGLPKDSIYRYPREFSGGQRQRIAIARAIISNPQFLLADEPVSALDVSTRVQIVELLAELTRSRGVTIAMVSHDLSIIAALCKHTSVIKNGRVVEQGLTHEVLGSPKHSYTQALIDSLPRLIGQPTKT